MFDFKEAASKHFSEKHILTQERWARLLQRDEKIINPKRRGTQMVDTILNDTSYTWENCEKLRRILWDYSMTLEKTEAKFFREGAEIGLEIPKLGISIPLRKRGYRG